jgi:hypothetical protein
MSKNTAEGFATALVVAACLAIVLYATSFAQGPPEEVAAYRNGAAVGACLALGALAVLLIVPVRKP